MRASPSRLLTTTAIVALAAMLGACAQSAPATTSAPEHPRPTPSASASAAPSSTPTTAPAASGAPGVATPPASAVELVDFETRNGSMRIQVPASWSVADTSEAVVDYEGRWRWDNQVTFTAEDGSRLWYWDGAPDNVGAVSEQRVVERVEMGSGLAAAAWWDRFDDSTYHTTVAVVSGEPPHSDAFMVDGAPRLHFLTYGPGEEERRFASREAAEEYLRSDAVALALDVMATVQITATEEVMPDDAGVEHEGTTYLPYTTKNGTATFLVPQDWWMRDDSSVGMNQQRQQVWDNTVTLYSPDNVPMLHYSDMWFGYPPAEDWEWTLGEVRPTQSEGWQAVSWTLGDSVPNHAGQVGVTLSDRAGEVRPVGSVCSENLCRSFASLPLDPQWFDPQLESTEAFFGSVHEEQMLTIVASLETHHDDATRMP